MNTAQWIVVCVTMFVEGILIGWFCCCERYASMEAKLALQLLMRK